jgi:hypothetical protein
MRHFVATITAALATVSCSTPPLTLYPADTPRIYKSLRISERDWGAILALIPSSYGLVVHGAVHNYSQNWVEVWMNDPSLGGCGGLVLLFSLGKDGQWQRINEGVTWGDCPSITPNTSLERDA